MREVVKPEMERRCVDRKSCQPVGSQLVEDLILEQNEMRALVDHAAELMLRSPDRDDRDERHRDIPPPAEAGALNHPKLQIVSAIVLTMTR